MTTSRDKKAHVVIYTYAWQAKKKRQIKAEGTSGCAWPQVGWRVFNALAEVPLD